MEEITLAGGCFWCTQAVFERLKGVESVVPGYTGGEKENPTYEEVATGETGHAEAIKIKFDPKMITLEQILEVFWRLHDPTTLNKQGADVGTQYRSAIFYVNEDQKKSSEDSLTEAQQSFKDKIVTEIVPLTKFYPAEKYHDEYYNNNRNKSYCQIVIDPKIQKLYKEFPSKTRQV